MTQKPWDGGDNIGCKRIIKLWRNDEAQNWASKKKWPAPRAAKLIMSKTTYWIRRSKRHMILAATAITITYLLYAATPPPDVRHRLSMGTAYAGLIFLAVSLWLGPWNVLRRHFNPVSFDLRRDIGIWTGVLAILHTAVGLTVHLRGRMWMYFFQRLHPLKLQNTLFGFANFVGLGAAILLLMLLAISNDISVRALGLRRWKSLQQWTYAVFGLTATHAIGYQLIEKRRFTWVVLFAVPTIAVLVGQGFGFFQVRARRSQSAAD
jgi:sulfoxide reductase heme-binding subunit YedZ